MVMWFAEVLAKQMDHITSPAPSEPNSPQACLRCGEIYTPGGVDDRDGVCTYHPGE
jgi:hypothetical protein